MHMYPCWPRLTNTLTCWPRRGNLYVNLSRSGRLQASYKGILNASLMEAGIKVLKRWYLVPACLARMYPTASAECFRGFSLRGTILHIWWECLRIRNIWNKVFCMFCKLTGAPIAQQVHVALLNDSPQGLSRPMRRLVHFVLAAKVTIARSWKSTSIFFYRLKHKLRSINGLIV